MQHTTEMNASSSIEADATPTRRRRRTKKRFTATSSDRGSWITMDRFCVTLISSVALFLSLRIEGSHAFVTDVASLRPRILPRGDAVAKNDARDKSRLGGFLVEPVRTRRTQQRMRAIESPMRLFASPPAVACATSDASSAALVYMALLALQFGTQPILTQKYAGRDSAILKRTYVGVQDLTRIVLCCLGLLLSVPSVSSILPSVLSYRPTLHLALFPASLYVLQNYCSITAYQSLDPITYNVLNQTKTIAAAFWCFILMRQRQSPIQMISLVLLVVAALIMESNNNPFPNFFSSATSSSSSTTTTSSVSSSAAAPAVSENEVSELDKEERQQLQQQQHRRIGLVAILTASMTSGLAGAWTQRCLQAGLKPCNSLVFSMELSAISFVILLASSVWTNPATNTKSEELTSSPESTAASSSTLSIRQRLFTGWTWKTWIPLLTNAFGGILVGLVTKHSGVVPKGFALILGLFLGGMLQNLTHQSRVTPHQWIGGSLAALSLYMHAAFPPS